MDDELKVVKPGYKQLEWDFRDSQEDRAYTEIDTNKKYVPQRRD